MSLIDVFFYTVNRKHIFYIMFIGKYFEICRHTMTANTSKPADMACNEMLYLKNTSRNYTNIDSCSRLPKQKFVEPHKLTPLVISADECISCKSS